MRQPLISLASALAFSSAGGAVAQSADLSRVTMRVLDDVSDIAAVVLELDVNRGDSEDGAAPAAAPGEPDTAARDAEEGGRDAAAREDAAVEERPGERRERDDLLDADRDERSEGRLEDRDVARRAVPPAAPVP